MAPSDPIYDMIVYYTLMPAGFQSQSELYRILNSNFQLVSRGIPNKKQHSACGKVLNLDATTHVEIEIENSI